MEKNRNQQSDSHGPQERRVAVQSFRIVVHHVSAEENLEVADHVGDQETEEDHSGDGHDRFLPDKGIVETNRFLDSAVSQYRAQTLPGRVF
jgi:hypothetical protein